jgi:hypothetical protein
MPNDLIERIDADRTNLLSILIQKIAHRHSHMNGNEDVLHDILYYDDAIRSEVRSLYEAIYHTDPDDDAMSDMIGDLVDAIIARRPKHG